MVMPKRTNFESNFLWIAIYHNVCHIFGILRWGGDVFFVWSLFKKKIFRLIYPRRLKWRKINRGEPQNKIEPSILVVRATTQINQNKIICKMQLKNRKCLKWNHNWKLFGVKPKRRTRLHKLGFKPNPEILLFRTIKGTFIIFIAFFIENFESSLLIFGPFSIEDLDF